MQFIWNSLVKSVSKSYYCTTLKEFVKNIINLLLKIPFNFWFCVILLSSLPFFMLAVFIGAFTGGIVLVVIILIVIWLTGCCKHALVLPWKHGYEDIEQVKAGVHVEGTGDVTVERTSRSHTKINSTGDVLVIQTGSGDVTAESRGNAFYVGKEVDPKHAAIFQNTMARVSAARTRLENGHEY